MHHFDGARFDVRQLFKHQPVKLLGNLPYSAGGAIMRNFMKRPSPVSKAVLMLQKEVGERLCTGPGSRDYSKHSVRVQAGWKPRLLRELPPEMFHPAPTIDSAIVHQENLQHFC